MHSKRGVDTLSFQFIILQVLTALKDSIIKVISEAVISENLMKIISMAFYLLQFFLFKNDISQNSP